MGTKDLLYFDWTPIAVLLNFVILYFIMKHFLYKPVKKMLDSRKEEVSKVYEDAQFEQSKAIELKNKYELEVASIKEKSSEILNNATKNAQINAEDILLKATNKSNQMIENANRQLENEKKKAMQQIKDEIADMTILAAKQVVKKELSPNDHKKLIENFIENVGDSTWDN